MKTLLKTISISAVCLALAVSASAQKCKFAVEETDPFTKKTTYTANMTIGPILQSWSMILQLIDGKYRCGMSMVNGETNKDMLPKGSKIELLFADESTLEIVATKDYESMITPDAAGSISRWLMVEELTTEKFAKLGSSPITALRLTISGKPYPYILKGIKEKQTKWIKETAACMSGIN